MPEKIIYSKLTAKRPWAFESPFRLFVSLFLALAIPTAILTGLTAFFIYKELAEQAVKQNKVTARLVAKQIDEELFGIRRYIESFATRRAIIDSLQANDSEAVQQQLANLVDQNRKISRAVLTDTNGVLLFRFPNDSFILGKDFSNRDWFKGASKLERPYVSEVYKRAALDKAIVVMIAAKIREPGRRPLGYLGGQYAIGDLMKWLSSLQPSESKRIAIFDQHGNQVLRLNAPRSSDISHHPTIQKILNQPDGSLFIDGLDDFDRCLVSHVCLPEIGWTVMAYRDTDVIFAPLHRLLGMILVFFLIALGALGLLGWFWHRVLFAYAQDLRRSNHELERFCYSIAHDLRAPLRAMQGFTEIIAEGYGDKLDEQGKDYARRVKSSAARMDKLVNDLLEYGLVAHRNLVFEDVNLSASFRHAISRMSIRIHQRHAEIKVPDRLGIVCCDKNMLQTIWEHLLSNALKYVAPNVTPKIEIWSEKKKGSVRVYVKDNGIGIAPGPHEKIFGVFQRLHGSESYSGTGIGLAIVKKATERIGGSVGFESELGQGSVFWIELPKK